MILYFYNLTKSTFKNYLICIKESDKEVSRSFLNHNKTDIQMYNACSALV